MILHSKRDSQARNNSSNRLHHHHRIWKAIHIARAQRASQTRKSLEGDDKCRRKGRDHVETEVAADKPLRPYDSQVPTCQDEAR